MQIKYFQTKYFREEQAPFSRNFERSHHQGGCEHRYPAGAGLRCHQSISATKKEGKI
jgi:hypothetical protein